MSLSEIGKRVLSIEAEAILSSIPRVEKNFTEAIEFIYNTKGRVVITGMGKSGLIGRKISATMTSTGTPSIYLHPSEALHGDIGIIRDEDIVLALSSSGNTAEIIGLISYIKRIGVKLISLVGNPNSPMAELSDVFLDCSVEKEACPLGMVPTTSTTLTLAVGDAIAVALMEKKGFTKEDFLLNHPGGNIGKKLLRVKNLMHTGNDLPIARLNSSMKDVLNTVNNKKFGLCIIADNDNNLKGLITDGDIRRAIISNPDLLNKKASDIIKGTPLTINENILATEALKLLEDNHITSLIVVYENKIKGLLHLHDLWRTEMI